MFALSGGSQSASGPGRSWWPQFMAVVEAGPSVGSRTRLLTSYPSCCRWLFLCFRATRSELRLAPWAGELGATWPPACGAVSPPAALPSSIAGHHGPTSGTVLTSCHLRREAVTLQTAAECGRRAVAAERGGRVGPPVPQSNADRTPSTQHAVETALTRACHPRNATSHPPKVIHILILRSCKWDLISTKFWEWD